MGIHSECHFINLDRGEKPNGYIKNINQKKKKYTVASCGACYEITCDRFCVSDKEWLCLIFDDQIVAEFKNWDNIVEQTND